jgi:hypothetical protein
MPTAPDPTGTMMGHGVYGLHSQAQHAAGGFGLPALRRAAAAAARSTDDEGPVVVADLGAAGGRNELRPMRVAIEALREAGVTAPVTVVHTDIPSNDFSSLFQTIEHDPDTYLDLGGVYPLAAGRSFYGRIFPPQSLTLAWSSIAVHWISRVPAPIHGHVYSPMATGEARAAFREQSAADWRLFLESRAVELRPGAEMVVVGGANRDDGLSGAEALMGALDAAIGEEVSAGALSRAECDYMSIPTWNRTLAEFSAPFDGSDGGVAGLSLVETELDHAPDAYLAAYRRDHDAQRFGTAVTGFLRAFTEPSLFGALPRSPATRAEIADRVYARVAAAASADPEAMQTLWHVAVLRIAKAA